MSDYVQQDGVLKNGFGLAPKTVMRDLRLSIEAKAIYAYIASFAGAGMTAFPSVDLICRDLKISKNRYFTHRKHLVDCGYVTIKRERKDSGFSSNIYTLAMNPVCLQNVDIRNVDTGIVDTGNVDIENEDTNSNSPNSNSLNNNSTKEAEGKPSLSSGDDAPTKVSVTEQIDLVVNAWNEISQQAGLSKVVAITKGSDRDTQLRARLKQFTVDDFIEAIQTIPFSPFLKGQNNRGWIITFNWFIKPSNFQKVLEGNYVGERRGVQNYASNTGGNQRKESTMDRARREQREFIERLNREPAQRANEDLGFHD